MSDIGDLLDTAEEAFSPLEDEMIVRNYVESDGPVDDYLDPTGGDSDGGTTNEHPNSPQRVDGSLELRGRASVDASVSGLDVEWDALAYIDPDAFLTDGGDEWDGHLIPGPSVIEDRGVKYHAVHVFNSGTGRTRVLCRTQGEMDSS